MPCDCKLLQKNLKFPGMQLYCNKQQSKERNSIMDLTQKITDRLNELRVNLQADGGDLEFVSFEDNKVHVRLTGACGNCPMATMTLKQGVERYLKDKVSADLEVVQAF